MDYFLSLANTYDWGCPVLMLGTAAGPNTFFMVLEKIQLADIKHQSHEYFGLLGIGNVGNNPFPKPFLVSSPKTQSVAMQLWYKITMIECAHIL